MSSQSFAEKFAGLMARPNQDLVAKDDVPWYLKYGGRVLGIVAAFCEYYCCLLENECIDFSTARASQCVCAHL